MTKKNSCFAVDDDETARLTVVSFPEDYCFIKRTGKYGSPVVALATTKNKSAHNFLPGIDMAGMNVLQLNSQPMHIPACVFIISDPGYAADRS